MWALRFTHYPGFLPAPCFLIVQREQAPATPVGAKPSPTVTGCIPSSCGSNKPSLQLLLQVLYHRVERRNKFSISWHIRTTIRKKPLGVEQVLTLRHGFIVINQLCLHHIGDHAALWGAPFEKSIQYLKRYSAPVSSVEGLCWGAGNDEQDTKHSLPTWILQSAPGSGNLRQLDPCLCSQEEARDECWCTYVKAPTACQVTPAIHAGGRG